MELRPLCPDDLLEVKALHEELFPVRYNMVSSSGDLAYKENVVIMVEQ